ncbi:hypothetical protein [Hydrogenophaga sp. NFH-34]|uniref:hypothetical protein n=1 Tax=Hydrogenophaga sp. NFH-34 TaxID=2744446 RepID=UPI001F17B36D|nr:hypothetical protein [Hydrogenophaga sp. NFH-34]
MNGQLLIGRAKFNYPPEFVNLPDHTAHAGQIVQILRACTADEADGPEQGEEQLYLVRADDGWQGLAFASELEIASDG